MNIIGIDPPVSKNCGWSVVSYENGKLTIPEKFTQLLDGYAHDGQKLQAVYLKLEEFILKYKPAAIAMERQMGNGVMFTRSKLNEFVGVIKLMAWGYNVEVIEVSPAHLKSVICEHGKAPKEKVISCIAKLFNVDEKGVEHDADAAACCVSYLIDKKILLNYKSPDPYTKEEAAADKQAKLDRKKKAAERKALKEAKLKENKVKKVKKSPAFD